MEIRAAVARARRCSCAESRTLRRGDRRRLRPDRHRADAAGWGTELHAGVRQGTEPFGRNAPAAFGHLSLVNIAVLGRLNELSGGLISSSKPGRDPEAGRYGALLNAITAEIPRRADRPRARHAALTEPDGTSCQSRIGLLPYVKMRRRTRT